jgi:hypothetical protein
MTLAAHKPAPKHGAQNNTHCAVVQVAMARQAKTRDAPAAASLLLSGDPKGYASSCCRCLFAAVPS